MKKESFKVFLEIRFVHERSNKIYCSDATGFFGQFHFRHFLQIPDCVPGNYCAVPVINGSSFVILNYSYNELNVMEMYFFKF